MPKIKSINPYTEELNAEFETLTQSEIDQKINIAHNAYLSWKNTPNSKKKELFLNLAKVIEKQKQELAKIEMIEM